MLNHLVVDTVEQGQACIEYLRKQSIGRASFIVLEKIGTSVPEAMATPENVPRLYDLVQSKDPRFLPAFFKAIGNTLVATDLDQANRIAFGGAKRWRVVTLGGQLIDTAGTMSGGGTKVMKGIMSSKLATEGVDASTLRRYERECEELTKQVEELSGRLKESEESLDALKREGPQLDVEIQKIELEMTTLQKRASEAMKRSESLK
jgi:structural maintenance of chromosome 4